jgi:PAS domain-containing protein
MRPTWHLVAAEDIRWLLGLTGPRVHQANGYQYRSLGIDAPLADRAARLFVRELQGGRSRTREELGDLLRADGFEATGLRLGYLIGHAEVEAILVNGPMRGRRQTFALLDESVPTARDRRPANPAAELALRYVRGHGPAQAIDLAWWSGLTLRDARLALEAASSALATETIDGRTFWVDPAPTSASGRPSAASAGESTVHLLPNYDELLVAFRDRSDAMDPALPAPARAAEEILAHVIVRDGLIVGRWKRRDGSSSTAIELDLRAPLHLAERVSVRVTIDRFQAFLGRPVEVSGLD